VDQLTGVAALDFDANNTILKQTVQN